MELRQLRYFLAVAECAHFTRAAEQLGMAQPPLSRQIQSLEREIGTALFIRASRGVRLTAAGELFKVRALQILADSAQAMSEVQSLARGVSGHLSIGFAGSIAFHPKVPRAIRSFRAAYPDVHLSSHENDSIQLVESVLSSRLDCAFVREPLDCGDLQRLALVSEELVLVVPTLHRLSREPIVDVAMLADEPFIMFPRAIGTHLYDYIIHSCQQAGFIPTIQMESPQVSSIVNMVAAGFGISLIPASMKFIQLPGVCFVPVRPILYSTVTFIYRRYERSALVLNLLKMLDQEN
ncbi:LysR family transcriptional regulator [Celerinatantimonas diazotrophica]|uniref:LysR family transcriptional regulator n=1 Tax=Celerinatantimonas diazotrophica TaxID=412034 RepID=A0A4R1J7Y6_9GAMM|nr:LysR family transcriptional regulator [Celerinatantimonas diazotrophica]TCK46414.1 LysR family transcriptional regulator [Celerinatantimonas diazotrophica]CAG9295209.1 HTH-type transcriptional regulator BenM [Celerinatantimonas diazotrophica]